MRRRDRFGGRALSHRPQGKAGGYDVAASGFAQNGWSTYSATSAFVFELVAIFLFVTVILNSTASGGAPARSPAWRSG